MTPFREGLNSLQGLKTKPREIPRDSYVSLPDFKHLCCYSLSQGGQLTGVQVEPKRRTAQTKHSTSFEYGVMMSDSQLSYYNAR